MIGARALAAHSLREVLELKPHLERALTRRLERAAPNVIDESETAREEAIRRVLGCLRSDTRAGWVLHIGAVEDVLEVHSHRESLRRALPAKLEDTSQTHGFRRPSLVSVVIIVGGTGSELPVRWVGPRRRVQYEILRGVDAMAVQIL